MLIAYRPKSACCPWSERWPGLTSNAHQLGHLTTGKIDIFWIPLNQTIDNKERGGDETISSMQLNRYQGSYGYGPNLLGHRTMDVRIMSNAPNFVSCICPAPEILCLLSPALVNRETSQSCRYVCRKLNSYVDVVSRIRRNDATTEFVSSPFSCYITYRYEGLISRPTWWNRSNDTYNQCSNVQ